MENITKLALTSGAVLTLASTAGCIMPFEHVYHSRERHVHVDSRPRTVIHFDHGYSQTPRGRYCFPGRSFQSPFFGKYPRGMYRQFHPRGFHGSKFRSPQRYQGQKRNFNHLHRKRRK